MSLHRSVGRRWAPALVAASALSIASAMSACGDRPGGGVAPPVGPTPPTPPAPPAVSLPSAAAQSSIAFEGVSLVDVVNGRVIPDQTVLVSAGVIQAVGTPAAVAIPAGTLRVAGAGFWLAPGLIDFHAHERAPLTWPDDFAGNAWMYLANGVTSVVNMGDFTDEFVDAKAAVRDGRHAGPAVYAGYFARAPEEGGGPHSIVGSPAQAEASVARARARGYDFIKVYSLIDAASFGAMMSAAAGAGLVVGGHAPIRVGLNSALDQGQRIVVHAAEFIGSHFGGRLDQTRIDAVAAELKARGTIVNPTQHVYELASAYGNDAAQGISPFQRMRVAAGREFMDDQALAAWEGMFTQRGDLRQARDLSPTVDFLRRFIAGLERAGVPLLAGTDNIGVPGIVPGFSMQLELAALERTGISRAAVLRSATVTPARVIEEDFPAHERTGHVEVGRRADLVLLTVDPLTDLEAYTAPAGVLANGRWYPRDTLRRALDVLRTTR